MTDNVRKTREWFEGRKDYVEQIEAWEGELYDNTRRTIVP